MKYCLGVGINRAAYIRMCRKSCSVQMKMKEFYAYSNSPSLAAILEEKISFADGGTFLFCTGNV